ncbi:hypothetical protein GWK47_026776 [Chionoecetes opilio]|uniref:Uncharacterized protein n=1 Tax=Chionoecetes opilio TaxID=41210 RepID=A0A8J8WL16_CHIOP|nr:hypothetical protein GWK47_026776 [Chionoecetes opilio]
MPAFESLLAPTRPTTTLTRVRHSSSTCPTGARTGRRPRRARTGPLVNGRAARPKFKLGSLEDHASAYLAITALEAENPTLRMEVGPNLSGEYILTPKDEESVALLRRLAEEGNRVLLLDPSVRRHKVGLERYPVDFR